MPGQLEIIERVIAKIKKEDHHIIDKNLEAILQGIAAQKKDEITEKLDGLTQLLRRPHSHKIVDYEQYCLPYMTHYLPKNYAKVQNALLELLRKDLLQENMSIWDIGAGPGTSAFAIANFFTSLAEAEQELGISRARKIKVLQAEKHAKNIELFKAARDEYYKRNQYAQKNIEMQDPVQRTIVQANFITEEYKGKFDIFIFANVLNEMTDNIELTVTNLSEGINKDGSMIFIDAADVMGTNAITRVKNALGNMKNPMTIYSPAGIWQPFCEFRDQTDYQKNPGSAGPCSYCCIEKPNMHVTHYPGLVCSRSDIRYSFVILRKDGMTTQENRPGKDYTKLKDIKPIGRTNVQVFKQRRYGRWDKPEKQYINDVPYSIWYTCDGTCGRKHTYLLTHSQKESEINDAQDGDILDIRNALIQKKPDGAEIYVTADEQAEIKIEKNTL